MSEAALSQARAAWSAVDLHLHTTASDGTLTPAQLVALARQRGVRVIAVTDHDSTEGVDAALEAARGREVEVVPGVEINTDVPEGELHILGYFLDHHDAGFQARLGRQRASRLDRGQGMVQRLRDLGLDVSWERVQQIAGAGEGGAVGRPHIARALVERGYVASVREAFDRYIGNDGPAYVPRAKVLPQDAVALILQAGGLPVLAHPADIPELETFVSALVEAGLVGLECYYGRYTPELVAGLVAAARRHGLVPTGGSDFHGLDVIPDFDLGTTPVPLEVVTELKARRLAAP
ncbi:MAG TPA: PHP domain-containing protein [Chloroflexota bacterium]|jgi:predicted metal-dependent phosphoesterase TrpH|nr:PHP domain-containing protein [Chloroflexota bacterium]